MAPKTRPSARAGARKPAPSTRVRVGKSSAAERKSKMKARGIADSSNSDESDEPPKKKGQRAAGSSTSKPSKAAAVKTNGKKIAGGKAKGSQLMQDMGIELHPKPPAAKAKKRGLTEALATELEDDAAEEAKAKRAKLSGAGTEEEIQWTDEHERQLWLMKAEPETRIEKGKDVKFGIDDLAVCSEPEPWTGVRNPVAKNNMVAMRVGDLAFFYHSNCKIPGVAGIMEIVREATPDESAFDPKDPYYDEKSDRAKPKWFNVHVEYRLKMPNYVSLPELRKHAEGELSGMPLLKQSRLSVSKVSKKHWDFIIELAGAETPPPHAQAGKSRGGALSNASAAAAAAVSSAFETVRSLLKSPPMNGKRVELATSREADATPSALVSADEDDIAGAVSPVSALRKSPPAATPGKKGRGKRT